MRPSIEKCLADLTSAIDSAHYEAPEVTLHKERVAEAMSSLRAALVEAGMPPEGPPEEEQETSYRCPLCGGADIEIAVVKKLNTGKMRELQQFFCPDCEDEIDPCHYPVGGPCIHGEIIPPAGPKCPQNGKGEAPPEPKA